MKSACVAVFVAGVLASCGSRMEASTTFSMSGGDFTGNSVRICGSRPAPDAKYRCASSLIPPDEMECPCFNFVSDGTLVDSSGQPLVINGLCPSSDTPAANWNFSYSIFSASDCGGTELNDGTHNFLCFDSKDIATKAFPNHSIESLNPGLNDNHILCSTKNASKQWNFTACTTVTTPTDITAGNVRYDCGCTAIAGTCNCGDGGVTAGDLEAECSFDPVTCDIVCPSRPDLAANLTGPDTLTVSVPDAYTLALTNVGTASSIDGTVTIVLPAGMTALPATLPSFCSVAPAGSPITCDLSLITPILPGDERDITFSVLACTPGPSDITGTVTDVTGEINFANNTATKTVTVDPLPPAPEPVLVYSENFSDGTPQLQPGGMAIELQEYTGGAPANFETYTAGPDWLAGSGNCNGWIMSYTIPTTANAPSTAVDAGCRANGGIDGNGTQQTAWWFQQQMADVIGLAQGMVDGTNNVAVSSMTNGGVQEISDLQLETLKNATHGKAGHYYQVSGYFAAVHCFRDRPGAQAWVDASEYMDLVIDGAPVSAVSAFNPCDNGLPGFDPYHITNNTPARVGRAMSAPIQLSTDADLGLRVRNATPAFSGNDIAFDLLQILDVTEQVDQCSNP